MNKKDFSPTLEDKYGELLKLPCRGEEVDWNTLQQWADWDAGAPEQKSIDDDCSIVKSLEEDIIDRDNISVHTHFARMLRERATEESENNL